MRTVVITWMDGQQEIYRCDEVRVIDNVLYLIQPRHPASSEPQRSFPIKNIRTWTVDSRT